MNIFTNKKSNILFMILGGFFVCNAVVAELIGAKIFSFEKTFGLKPLDISIFGQAHLSLNLTTGTLMWPFIFVITDIINEYYGKKGVRFLSYLTVALIAYTFCMIFAAMNLAPADVWLAINNNIQPNINVAFQQIFGQGMNVIIGSITAFLISQWVDMTIFHYLRHRLREKNLGKRALISTIFSQLIDSFLVSFIAFYLLGNWSLALLLAILVVSYPFKCLVAIVMTPVLYFVHYAIEKYLGEELATQLKAAAKSSNGAIENLS